MAKKGLAVTGLDSAGGTIQPSQTKWTFNGNPVAIVGSPVASHAPCPLPAIHCGPDMAEGQNEIKFNGIPVCFEGHAAECGHTATGRTEITLETS